LSIRFRRAQAFFVGKETEPFRHREVFDGVRAYGDERFHNDTQLGPSLCRNNATHTGLGILVHVKYLNLNANKNQRLYGSKTLRRSTTTDGAIVTVKTDGRCSSSFTHPDSRSADDSRRVRQPFRRVEVFKK